MKKLRSLLLAAAALATLAVTGSVMSSRHALAQNPNPGSAFTVNSTADVVDARPGDGTCATATGACTLRAAIQEANSLAGSDTIILPAGTYTLTITGRGETAAATGDLDITDSLTIRGAGAATTIVQACAPVPVTAPCSGIDCVFHVDPNTAGISVMFSVMTIQNGSAVGLPFMSGSGGAFLLGSGGIGATPASGRLTLTDCVVANNSTAGNSTARDGGGLYNKGGSLMLIRTNVIANSASNCGGIGNEAGILSLTDSTVSLNAAAQGGRIFSGEGATLGHLNYRGAS